MGWTKVKDKENTFCTFASDLSAFKRKTGHDPRCPLCRKELKMSFLFAVPVTVDDEPYAMFKDTHKCGAHIIIFND